MYLKSQQCNFNSKSLKQNPVAHVSAAFCSAEELAFKKHLNARDYRASRVLAAQSIAPSATSANNLV